MTKKTYNVTIEQPMIFSVTVEAEDIEQAEEMAIEIWNNKPIEAEGWDYGTDAQIQAEAEDGSDCSDWHDLD